MSTVSVHLDGAWIWIPCLAVPFFLDLDVGTHSLGHAGAITFSDKNTQPAAIRTPRHHPRER